MDPLSLDANKYYQSVDTYHELAEASHIGQMIDINMFRQFVDMEGMVIDVAGGTGINAELFHIRQQNYVAVDLSLKGLEIMLAKARGSAVVSDVALLPFRSNSCSTVLCSWSLEHIVEPERALLEMIRIVKPGGRIMIWGPNWDNIFRKDFPQFVHKKWWEVERIRWQMVGRMFMNELFPFRYRPYINTDVAAFRFPDNYVSKDTDATHCVLCQETVFFFRQQGFQIKHLSDLSELVRHVNNSLLIRLVRKLLTPLIPVIRKLPFVRWFVIRFPIVVEKGICEDIKLNDSRTSKVNQRVCNG